MYNTSLAENQDACLVKNLGLEIPESLLTDSPLVRLTRIPLSLKPLKIVVKTSKKFSKNRASFSRVDACGSSGEPIPWEKAGSQQNSCHMAIVDKFCGAVKGHLYA
jgi:hypothetical protein